jgi:hypothetical protein
MLRGRQPDQSLSRVTKALERLSAWQGKSPAIEKEPGFQSAFKQVERAMLAAIHRGHENHPLVREWLTTRRALGQRDLLRRARSGVERATKRVLRPDDLRLAAEVERLASAGKSRSAVQRELTPRLVKTMSRQGFHKLLTRLDLHHLFSR